MYISLFILSAFVSALGTMAGFGGGIFIVPIMVMGFGVPIEIAIGVTAMSMFPSSLLSTVANTKKKLIDFKLMWALEIPTIIGAVIGAKLTVIIPTKPLEIIFAVFLLFLGWKMSVPPSGVGPIARLIQWLNSRHPLITTNPYKVSLWASVMFGSVAGVLAGLFGIGGGILKTPIMLKVFHVPIRTATATALCMITFTSFSSGFTHWQLGHFDLDILVATVGGFFTGAIFGNWYGVKLQDDTLKKIIAGAICMAGAAILIHAF